MKERGASDIFFSVLGEFRADRGGREIDLGPPQQRAVAAALLLAQGRPLAVNDIAEAVWERPPDSWASLVRTYIWRLRKTLEPSRSGHAPWQLLRSVAGGYVLEVDNDCVDWQVFQQHVERARATREAGDRAAALRAYDNALALWQKHPLAAVPGPLADRERSRMRALHLDILEERLRFRIDTGHYAQAITEAGILLLQHPAREELHHALVSALHRAGRQADALDAYHVARHVLKKEHGAAPGEHLRTLYTQILRANRFAGAPGNTATVQHGRSVPRQLPYSAVDFTGRLAETERIRNALAEHPTHTPPTVLVTGIGGVGKTTLALHSVRTVLASYPDGQLYTDLRGVDGTPAEPGAVLASFLRALGQPDSSVPGDLDERATLYRTLLAERRVLIVLDNAADTGQIIHLLPNSPTCAVVITSRNSLAALPVGLRIPLGALPSDEAMQLFIHLVGSTRVTAEPQAARTVLTSCGGLPLAIRIIGSRLAARPDWNMAQLAQRLNDEQQRLAELAVDSVAVESSFSLGYTQLDTRARRTFRLLAFPTQSGFDAALASRVMAAPEEDVRRTLDHLVSAGLLETPAVGRYRYHDLVLLFAQRLAARTDSAADRYTALGALLDHHLIAVAGTYHFLLPGHTVPRTESPVLRNGPLFTDVRDVLAWAASQLGDILELVARAAASHTDRAATLLLMLGAAVLTAHRWHELVPVANAVAEAAAVNRDSRSEGRARYMLAGGLAQVGRLEDAKQNVLRALELTDRVRDEDVHAMALNLYGVIIGWHDPVAGIGKHRKAAELAHQRGNTSLEAAALGNVVQTRLLMPGMDDDTVAASQRQLHLYRSVADRLGEATGHYRHGQVLLRQGLPQAAISAHLHTLALLEEGEQTFIQGGTHMRLSEAYLDIGQADSALEHAEQALALSRELRHDHLGALSLSVIGDALAALERHQQARTYWQRAMDELQRLEFTNDAERVAQRLAHLTERTAGPR